MRKIIALLIINVLLFSFRGFSQASESEHPLLDKYYPQKQVDTTKAVTNKIKTMQTNAAPVVNTSPVTTPAVPPASTVTVPPTTVTTSEVTTSSVTTTSATTTTPVNKPGVVKPVATVPAPVQKTAGRPATSLYTETRLGSSSPLYDTYEKNSNGAGSVTTNPK